MRMLGNVGLSSRKLPAHRAMLLVARETHAGLLPIDIAGLGHLGMYICVHGLVGFDSLRLFSRDSGDGICPQSETAISRWCQQTYPTCTWTRAEGGDVGTAYNTCGRCHRCLGRPRKRRVRSPFGPRSSNGQGRLTSHFIKSSTYEPNPSMILIRSATPWMDGLERRQHTSWSSQIFSWGIWPLAAANGSVAYLRRPFVREAHLRNTTELSPPSKVVPEVIVIALLAKALRERVVSPLLGVGHVRPGPQRPRDAHAVIVDLVAAANPAASR